MLPVKKYGGIERMLFWHMKELVKQGHKPVLIGHADCQIEEYGIELIPKTREDWWLQIPKDSDAVQLFYNYQPPIDLPVINTIGGNGQIGEKFHRNSVFVSRSHALHHNSESFIYNALDFDEYPFDPQKNLNWENFLFLAKASWSVKNLKHTTWAVKKARKKLHICGGRSYLPSRYVHSYGMVGGAEKVSLMKKCDALLFPIRWHEPFGLAVVEAFAMGLPAITSPYGSMKELINPTNGLICHSKEQLRDFLLQDKPSFSPSAIRADAQSRFSISQFTSSYIQLFEKLISKGGYLNESEPTWSLPDPPLKLLPF